MCSQATLSQQIRQLEETLRVQLLNRSGRTIQLTDSGAAYLRYARLALQDLDAGKRAIHDVQDLSRGSLRFAMTPTFTAYLIGPLVKNSNNRYPNITLTMQEMPQERMEALLNEDDLASIDRQKPGEPVAGIQPHEVRERNERGGQ